MRKLFTLLLGTGLVLGLGAVPVAAVGPPCAQILTTSSDGLQDSRAAYDGDTGEVVGQFFLPREQCKQVTYTLWVLDNDGDTEPIASASVVGDGSDDSVEILITGVAPADDDVCVYVTTTIGKKKTADRAPDEGCVVLLADGSSPGGGKGF